MHPAINTSHIWPELTVARNHPQHQGSAALHGLWYVAVSKLGTIAAATNYHPWQDYTPAADWLRSWWNGDTVNHAQYLELSARFRTGHLARKRDAAEVARDERESALREHVRAEAALLVSAAPLRPFRIFPEVEEFIEAFRHPLHRRRILALIGGTNSGKSLFAAMVLQNLRKHRALRALDAGSAELTEGAEGAVARLLVSLRPSVANRGAAGAHTLDGPQAVGAVGALGAGGAEVTQGAEGAPVLCTPQPVGKILESMRLLYELSTAGSMGSRNVPRPLSGGLAGADGCSILSILAY